MLARALFALAFLSGTAALVYEVVWARTFALTFGSSTLAASASVAGFMGGMGLGAHFFPRWLRPGVAPLRAYAALEFGIAISAALFTAGFQGLPGLFAAVVAALPAGAPLDLLRVIFVFVLLLVPSALMGATFPALCMALLRSRGDVDRHLGWIYGWNTLGAATGALLAGFVTVEWLGLRGSVALAVSLNVGVGLVALVLARTAGAERTVAPPTDEGIPSRLPAWLVGTLLFAAGFATLAYEILWFRALRYLVGNSTYALSLIFAVFLLGLGLGALVYRPILRRFRAEAILGVSQLLIAVLAVAAIGLEVWILADPELTQRLSIYSKVVQAREWWRRLALASGLGMAVMLPPALLMGLAFPLASRLFLGRVEGLGPRIGLATLLSNLGSIAGSLGATLLILPALGTLRGTLAVALVNLALGAAVLSRLEWPAVRRSVGVALPAGAILAALLLFPAHMPITGERAAHRLAPVLVFEREHDLGTVQVRQVEGEPAKKVMAIDGAMIAASTGFLEFYDRKQHLLAHLPLTMDRSLRRTLNIGLASGSTLEALAGHEELVALDTVEINPAVSEGAALFPEARALDDPRSTLLVEDAIHHLLTAAHPYDLIVSDGKQNKDYSGNAKILSWEFMDYAKRGLSPCGLFEHWIPGSLEHGSFRIVVRTMLDVFPEVEVFLDGSNSVLMIGSRCPIGGREGLSQAQLDASGAPGVLGPFGLGRTTELKGLWIAGRPGLEAVLDDGPLNDWNHLPLEYRSYRERARNRAESQRNLEWLIAAGAAQPTPGWAGSADERELVAALRRVHLARLRGQRGEARRLLDDIRTEHPDHPVLLQLGEGRPALGESA